MRTTTERPFLRFTTRTNEPREGLGGRRSSRTCQSAPTGRPTAVEHAPIPGGYAAERVGGFGFQGFLRRKQGGRRARYRNRRGRGSRWKEKPCIRQHCPRGDCQHSRGQRNGRSFPPPAKSGAMVSSSRCLKFRRFTICLFYQFATSASNCCQDRYEEILSKTARY